MSESSHNSTNIYPDFEKYAIRIFLVISLFGGLFLGYIVHSIDSSSELKKLTAFSPNLPTRIYDVNGQIVAELFQHQRKLVRLSDIPTPVIGTFLAVEDTNFYDHIGIDIPGIIRAMFTNLRHFRVVQGGSTITQQLVKVVFTKGERKIGRKISEAILALQVEKEFSKDEILEFYFNQIYFGHGAYGIASASEFYFDKPVEELNLMEGSILAALPKSPHTYSPVRSFHVAYEKNKIILKRFIDLGYLSREEADEAYEKFWDKYWNKVALTPETATIYGEKTDQAPYFTEYIRQQLISMYGENRVYGTGLNVYTTVNLKHQKIAEKYLLPKLYEQESIARESNNSSFVKTNLELFNLYQSMQKILVLPEINRQYSLEDDFREKFKSDILDGYDLLTGIFPVSELNSYAVDFFETSRELNTNVTVQGAFISMEPSSGRITAMIGGRDFKASDQNNRALQARRQPGSAMKPFVYGAALEDRSVHYASGFIDAPIMDLQPDGTSFAPQNYAGGYKGHILLYRALAESLNLVTIQVYDLIGADKIVDFASRLMKVKENRFNKNPSLALGSSELTPMELLRGYSVLGNDGKDVEPHGIVYIADRDGNIIYEPEKQIYEKLNKLQNEGKLQIVEPGVEFILRKMLQGVMDHGTATEGVRVKGGFNGPAAGKTGTTSSWNDAWFAGFTKDLAAVVWMGLDKGSLSLGKHQAGGVLCAPVWGEFMNEVYKSENRKPEPFNDILPKDVIPVAVCTSEGKLPNESCNPPQETMLSYVPAPLKMADGKQKMVKLETCDCNVQKTMGFLDVLQEESKISDEELGKKKSFNKNFGQ
ncbi:MAG: PBP1A family penicillin-binding protein [Spirochaetia bacterium]|nr:PBP1A family penicillin-binding protein [Spirochaetia bacterium]